MYAFNYQVGGPGRPREDQGEDQGGPGRPREAQGGPGRTREAQGGPGRPRHSRQNRPCPHSRPTPPLWLHCYNIYANVQVHVYKLSGVCVGLLVDRDGSVRLHE